jgi:hypothetical protein
MKNLLLSFIILFGMILISCTKEAPSQQYNYLTGVTWLTDSLLANGEEAGGIGGLLEKFKGEANFRKDGTGKFGTYTGKWNLAFDDTQIMIKADSLPITLTTQIIELTQVSLKVTTEYPNLAVPEEPIKIRMTFKSR